MIVQDQGGYKLIDTIKDVKEEVIKSEVTLRFDKKFLNKILAEKEQIAVQRGYDVSLGDYLQEMIENLGTLCDSEYKEKINMQQLLLAQTKIISDKKDVEIEEVEEKEVPEGVYASSESKNDVMFS
jgi:6-pyruvoyl-tetrahydropterin synthase